jgi:hypothetical protein
VNRVIVVTRYSPGGPVSSTDPFYASITESADGGETLSFFFEPQSGATRADAILKVAQRLEAIQDRVLMTVPRFLPVQPIGQ